MVKSHASFSSLLLLLTSTINVSAFSSTQRQVTFLKAVGTSRRQRESPAKTTLFHHVEGEMHPEGEGSAQSASETVAASPLAELLLAREAIQKQMYQLKSKYPTSEADYLAAARERAAQKVESINSQAKDEDWQLVAKVRKETVGEVDDWEASLGNGVADSQILLMADPGNSDDEDNKPEPKLLLF